MLLSQGLDNCEVIIVNDGSTDRTEEICKSYSKTDERIKVITIPNSGVSVARNTGYKYATGDYIYFLDSDDTLFAETISYYISTINSIKNIDIFSFGYASNKDGQTYNHACSKHSREIFDPASEYLEKYLLKKVKSHICTVIVLRSLLLKNQIEFTPGTKMGEDVEFLITVFSIAQRIYYDARLCFSYQIRNDSSTQGWKVYTEDHFGSFLAKKRAATKLMLRKPDMAKPSKFFVANDYCSALRYYLKSKCKNAYFNEEFKSNKKVLVNNLKGNFMNNIVIFFVRLTPIKLLLWVFKKI